MAVVDPWTYDEFVNLLRVRLGYADDLTTNSHHFKELFNDDEKAVIPDHWYQRAFDDLEAQGHLDPVSAKVMGDAHARLSPWGREYLKSEADEDSSPE